MFLLPQRPKDWSPLAGGHPQRRYQPLLRLITGFDITFVFCTTNRRYWPGDRNLFQEEQLPGRAPAGIEGYLPRRGTLQVHQSAGLASFAVQRASTRGSRCLLLAGTSLPSL